MILNKALYITFCFLLPWIFFGPASTGYCQDSGFKYIGNYSSKEYNRQPRNYCVLEDKRGIIYVGNNNDLLEFDGVSWRTIDVRNNYVRSMAMGKNGKIYIGGKNEFGCLEPDSKGTLQYVSLLNHLNEKDRHFENVWQTHSTTDGIYFRTSKYLFIWNPGSRQMKTIAPPREFKFSYTSEGNYFIQDKKDGLLHMVNDSLEPVPGGGTLKEEKIYMATPYGPGFKVLIGTRGKGFYIYDGKTARRFPMEADNFLERKKLTHGTRLFSGDFALATQLGGLVIIDSRGRINEIFNTASGLPDDSVKYVYQDSRGNLWLALDKGISKIEYVSPFSFYDDRSNLPGNVLSVVRHNNGLYAGTSRGLFLRDDGNRFRPVEGITSSCYALLSIDGSLLAATTNGVLQVGNTEVILKNPSYVFLFSRKEKNRVWVGTRNGPVALTRNGKNGFWTEEHRFQNINKDIKTIVEDPQGNLWLGTETQGAVNVTFFPGGTISDPRVIEYNELNQLPPGPVRVFWAAEHLMFATKKGIYRFVESTKTIVPDPTLGNEFTGGQSGSRGVFRIAEDKREDNQKNIWLHSMSRNFQVFLNRDGTAIPYQKPFLRLPDAQVNAIYPDPGGNVTWFAGNDGLIRYETTLKKDYRTDFFTLIRKVYIDGKPVFDGYKVGGKHGDFFPVIEYRDRNLRFEFAAPFFEDETNTRYRCVMEGYQKEWSAWGTDTDIDYTNLDSGTYTFKVQAKNIYGHKGREALFKFRILPPWYATWWAFIVYAIAGFLTVFVIVKWRSGKLEKEKEKLEQIVKDRTAELQEKNRQLLVQSEKLKEMDNVKSRFFANISHEFRTPLTLIMGPLEQLLSNEEDPKNAGNPHRKEFSLMYRNSRRLLSLINQLLELAKFDSGKMKPDTSPQNIIPFLNGIITSFEALAEKNRLSLTFQAETEDFTLDIDSQKMEEAVVNLLSNAVKFTPPGGKITVKIFRNPTEEETFPGGSVGISISDTGPGIPRDQLAHIFDRFYQSTHTRSLQQKGTGIGLAIAKEVVALHHGKIDVHSREGENSGTEFIIKLPAASQAPHEPPICDTAHNVGNHLGRAKRVQQHAGLRRLSEGQGEAPPGPPITLRVEMPVTEQEIPRAVQSGSGSMLVLVVEDNLDVRDFIRGSLEPEYTVAEAKDGREGIAKARELIPDLIISDIMMPEADGYELCRVLKKDIKTSHVPIILLTAKASEENVIEGLETGADDYITKPFNTKILCTRVKNLIDLRRRLQEKIQRENMLQPTDIPVSSMDQTFIKELRNTIEKHMPDPLFNVEQLGKKLYMSRASLYRKVFALTGEPPRDFIKSCRLKRGAQLLKGNFGNVTEVAFEVGFSSTAYFTKCFKEKFHQLPRTYQEVGKH